MGLAAPVFATGGFAALGAASLAACLAAAAVAASLPQHRVARRPDGQRATRTTPAAILREGLRDVRASPAVRGALLLAPAVAAVWGTLDEYLPLLAVEAGFRRETVPLVGLLLAAAVAAGGVLADRLVGRSGRAVARLLLAAAAALALGALVRVPAGFALIALAFGAFQAVTVVADARLQDAIEGDARSTVTSFAGLLTEGLVLGVFAAYAAGSLVADHATLFAAAAAYLAVSPVAARVLAPRRPGAPPGG